MTDGTLGTDVVFDTSQSLTGGKSIRFPSTASANCTVASDIMLIDDPSPTGASNLSTTEYFVRAHARASSVAANKDIAISVGFYTIGMGAASTTVLFNNNLAAADTWQSIGGVVSAPGGPTEYRKMRIFVQRPTDYDFDAYIDSVEVRRCPPYYRGVDSSGTFTNAFASPTWSQQYANRLSESAGVVTISQPGLYTASGSCIIASTDSLADGDMFGCRVGFRPTASANYTYFYGNLTAPAALTPTNPHWIGMSASGLFEVNAALTSSAAGSAVFQVVQYAGTLLDFEAANFTVARISE
ncbi:MAG: hypothetical protein GWO40_05570 [Gammaproteobacteria bacterium]|nr:hypothetical protein [Gammaproteobacteria bacterium]NIV51089.1 hypothetical protein [Gammaproteobacteria bacterium]NIX85032.1 hypothetical protein [Gammaproteobacteria bacterium]